MRCKTACESLMYDSQLIIRFPWLTSLCGKRILSPLSVTWRFFWTHLRTNSLPWTSEWLDRMCPISDIFCLPLSPTPCPCSLSLVFLCDNIHLHLEKKTRKGNIQGSFITTFSVGSGTARVFPDDSLFRSKFPSRGWSFWNEMPLRCHFLPVPSPRL